MSYKARLHSVASALSLADAGLSLYSRVTRWPDLPTIDPEIREFTLDSDDTRGKVLLPLVQGENGWVNVYQSCIIAHALRLRGYEPLLVVCDGKLEMCFKKSAPDDEFSCDKCQFRTNGLVERFGLEATYLSDIPCDVDPDSVIETADELAGLTYRGVDVSSFSMATTRRFLKKYHVDLSDPADRELYTAFLRTAITLAERMTTLLSRTDVVAASGANSAYNSSGIGLRVAEARGIPTTVFMAGFSAGKLIIGGENPTNAFFSDPGYLARRLSTPLTPEQRTTIGEMMDGRVDGSTVRIKWAGESDSRLKLGETGQTSVGLFTNLMWDASLETDQVAAFDDPFKWVAATIEYFETTPDRHLVVKTHPAEAVRGTNEGMSQWIDQRFESLPDNVVLLEPDTEVSPYKLADQLNAVTVWNSTVGLEMAYFGVPTIVAGNAHYRDWGFTYDAVDAESYLAVFDDFPLTMTEEMRNRARRYAHHHFVEKQIDFPFYSGRVDGTSFSELSSDDLRPGVENVDAIVETICEGAIPEQVRSI